MFARLNGWVVATCVVGAGLTWLFLPTRLELAYLKILDRDYQGARGILTLDAAYASPTTREVLVLATAWSLEGYQEEAISVLESRLEQDPSALPVQDLLERIYNNADLNADVPDLLAGRTYTSSPGQILRQQIATADAYGQAADMAAAIEQLREHGQAGAAELVRLGLWYAARAVSDRAVDALLAANILEPQSLNQSDRRSLAALLIDNGRELDAVALVQRWFKEDDEGKMQFAYWMVDQGWVSAAAGVAGQTNSAHHGALLAYADMQLGADDTALDKLRKLAKAGSLDEPLIPYFGTLALRRNSNADMRQAIPLLRTHIQSGGANDYSRDVYVEMLRRLRREDELIDYWRQVDGHSTAELDTDQHRLNIMRALVSLARYEPIMQPLRTMALRAGNDWMAAYVAAAKQQRDWSGLADTLRTRGTADSLDDSERRNMAYVLLDAGKKEEAIELLMKLGERADPASSAITDLLYLFGPRPDENAMKWLMLRARSAPVAQRAAWLRHIAQRGGAPQVITLVEAWGSPNSLPVLQVHVEAAFLMKDWERFDKAFPKLVELDRDAAARRRYAYWASERGNDRLTEWVWHALLEVSPDEPDALREVGMAHFARRDYPAAIPYLFRYVDLAPREWEIAGALGDALWESKRVQEARRVYRDVLNKIPRAQDLTQAQRLRHAVVAWRAGDTVVAHAMFRELVAVTSDPLVTAEYASFLLSQGKSHDAVRMLDERNSEMVRRVVVR